MVQFRRANPTFPPRPAWLLSSLSQAPLRPARLLSSTVISPIPCPSQASQDVIIHSYQPYPLPLSGQPGCYHPVLSSLSPASLRPARLLSSTVIIPIPYPSQASQAVTAHCYRPLLSFIPTVSPPDCHQVTSPPRQDYTASMGHRHTAQAHRRATECNIKVVCWPKREMVGIDDHTACTVRLEGRSEEIQFVFHENVTNPLIPCTSIKLVCIKYKRDFSLWI